MTDYANYDAVGLGELVRRGEVSPAELLEEAIRRTQAGNGTINAVVHRLYDEARADAGARLPASPLAGVPFLIKDMAYVKNAPCTLGSRFFANEVPDHDAEIVARYRRAGLIIYGKSNTPELGLAATTEGAQLGTCRNPWHTDYTPGGSSGGAGAAVAAGWLPAAHATDGGGSIRIPASCCGLVGLKPTRARTPLGPDVGEGWGGMSIGHVVCRSVRDSAAFLDATHGYASGDPYCAPPFAGSYLRDHESAPETLRVAVDCTPMTGAPLHADCAAAVAKAIGLLESLGHKVTEAAAEFDRQGFGAYTYTLVAANVAQTLDAQATKRGREPGANDIEPVTRNAAAFGRSLRADQYARAVLQIHRVGRVMAAFMTHFDLILSPTLVSPPVPIGWLDPKQTDTAQYDERFRAFWGFTSLYNATGQPAISLPLHSTDSGLPVGVQLAGRFGDELTLLRVARQIETAVGGFNRIAA
jgi:amidase/6-aminohexanoate-cyclic-dimer hydrolase